MHTNKHVDARFSITLVGGIMLACLSVSCSSTTADSASGSKESEPVVAPPVVEQVVPESVGVPTSPAAPAQALNAAAETESAPATPEATEATLTLEQRVTPIVSSVADAKLLFIACDQTPCTLRAQSTSLGALHQVLTALSNEFDGQIAFSAREQLDAYTGRSFQADVMLDVTEGARPVPADENDLIAAQ